MSSSVYVVVGGQNGSEAKGAVAGRVCADLAARGRRVVCVRVGGPNAGHTVIGACPEDCTEDHAPTHPGDSPRESHPWRLRQVPVAAVTDIEAKLVIAAGSEIDPEVLAREIAQLDSAGYEVTSRLFIDRSATWLTAGHIFREVDSKLSDRIGSTAKGIGAARADRIWRTAQTWADFVQQWGGSHRPQGVDFRHVYQVDSAEMLHDLLGRAGYAVVIEGTQGYSLGLHTQNYPQVTSGDCRAIDFLAQAGVSPWQRDGDGWGVDTKVVIAVRPYPIRVAGNSGPLKNETTWAELGLPEEYTTVTQKVRRVGAWDPEQVRQAIRANGGPNRGVVWLALTMQDTVCPEIAGQDSSLRGWAGRLDDEQAMVSAVVGLMLSEVGATMDHLGYIGTGPDTALVNDRMYE